VPGGTAARLRPATALTRACRPSSCGRLGIFTSVVITAEIEDLFLITSSLVKVRPAASSAARHFQLLPPQSLRLCCAAPARLRCRGSCPSPCGSDPLVSDLELFGRSISLELEPTDQGAASFFSIQLCGVLRRTHEDGSRVLEPSVTACDPARSLWGLPDIQLTATW